MLVPTEEEELVYFSNVPEFIPGCGASQFRARRRWLLLCGEHIEKCAFVQGNIDVQIE